MVGFDQGSVDEIVECNPGVPCFEITASGGIFGESTQMKGCLNPPMSCEYYEMVAAPQLQATVESCGEIPEATESNNSKYITKNIVRSAISQITFQVRVSEM